MKIANIIEKIKLYHKGYYGKQGEMIAIDPKTTRDKVLFGNPDIECLGIVSF